MVAHSSNDRTAARARKVPGGSIFERLSRGVRLGF
jgi:hypothetical protein